MTEQLVACPHCEKFGGLEHTLRTYCNLCMHVQTPKPEWVGAEFAAAYRLGGLRAVYDLLKVSND